VSDGSEIAPFVAVVDVTVNAAVAVVTEEVAVVDVEP